MERKITDMNTSKMRGLCQSHRPLLLSRAPSSSRRIQLLEQSLDPSSCSRTLCRMVIWEVAFSHLRKQDSRGHMFRHIRNGYTNLVHKRVHVANRRSGMVYIPLYFFHPFFEYLKWGLMLQNSLGYQSFLEMQRAMFQLRNPEWATYFLRSYLCLIRLLKNVSIYMQVRRDPHRNRGFTEKFKFRKQQSCFWGWKFGGIATAWRVQPMSLRGTVGATSRFQGCME